MITHSEDLEILLTVVNQESFSKAAEKLRIQPAKVSRSIARIERQLNTTLINRTTRHFYLTHEGINFIERVKTAMSEIEYAEECLLNKNKAPSGKLRVDAASPFLFHQIIPLVSEFNELYPDIELDLTANEGYTDLIKNKTDLAIRIGKLNDSSLVASNLGKSKLFIVASPDYLEESGYPSTPKELDRHKLIGFTEPNNLNDWNLKKIQEIKPDIKSNNGEVVRQLTLAGQGISCLSGFMVGKDIEKGHLVPLLEKFQLQNSKRENIHAVYYKTSAVSERVKAFIEFIRPRIEL